MKRKERSTLGKNKKKSCPTANQTTANPARTDLGTKPVVQGVTAQDMASSQETIKIDMQEYGVCYPSYSRRSWYWF
jgi:hypothetical protein